MGRIWVRGGFSVVEIPEGNISDGGGLLVVSGEGGVRLLVPSGGFIGGTGGGA